MPSVSVIVASCGRPTLARTVESARGQMLDGDELLISVQSDCPWGHRARNQLMRAARGDALMFIDDDDAYLPGAFDAVRAGFAEAPDRMHLFRMRYPDGRELWQDRAVVCGNVSTQIVVVPSVAPLLAGCEWGQRYEGDFDFISACAGRLGEPVWHEQVIAAVRPGGAT